jgi:excisionase family DNA binding protein
MTNGDNANQVTYLTTKQVGDHFGVTAKTVRVWIKQGRFGDIPIKRTLGGLRRFHPDTLKALSSPVA